MATGAGWQPAYSTATTSTKYTPSPTSTMFFDGSVTLEYTQDLHLKMSKKIAQLTKVCVCVCEEVWWLRHYSRLDVVLVAVGWETLSV